jgi:hypothetical protein
MEGGMSAPTPERPSPADDLAQAYARAHAVTDADRGPSAAVRANVLAAAREIAAQAAQPGAPSAQASALTPVAPAVAAVGRDRPRAVNLGSWRLRAGAAVCAALLVGVASWRFETSRRFDADTQVAAASPDTRETKGASPLPPVARDLPAPQVGAPSIAETDAATQHAAPAVVADAGEARAKAPADARIIQPRDAAALSAQPGEARVQAKRSSPIPVAPPAPVVTVSSVAQAAREPALAYVPPQAIPERATPNAAPAPEPRPTAIAPAAVAPPIVVAAAAPLREQVADADAASAKVQRTEITGGLARSSAAVGAEATAAPEPAKRSAPASANLAFGASARRGGAAPLQAAADRGDVEALKALLASPATRVDAPDADGRTALLHAVLAQQVAAVRLLVAAGADPGRADLAGLTPRSAASTGANAEIAALLAAPH